MPVSGGFEVNPKHWQRALDLARSLMLDAGWIERSLKFNEVRLRKARKIYATL